jgi:hypothetical protein
MGNEEQPTSFGAQGTATSRAIAQPEPEKRSELDEPRWSVVSFDKREAGGLTYRQATELMSFLEGRRVNGLCIVTDESANRYDN